MRLPALLCGVDEVWEHPDLRLFVEGVEVADRYRPGPGPHWIRGRWRDDSAFEVAIEALDRSRRSMLDVRCGPLFAKEHLVRHRSFESFQSSKKLMSWCES
jgi:hypothetical protein